MTISAVRTARWVISRRTSTRGRGHFHRPLKPLLASLGCLATGPRTLGFQFLSSIVPMIYGETANHPGSYWLSDWRLLAMMRPTAKTGRIASRTNLQTLPRAALRIVTEAVPSAAHAAGDS